MSVTRDTVSAEARWLAAWMDAELGGGRSTPVSCAPASAWIQAFWDAVGYATNLESAIADPDPRRGRAQVDLLVERWREDGEPGADAELPTRFRLVEIDGNSMVLTDESADDPDPPVVVIIDADAVVRPAWASYLRRATAGIVSMIARRFDTMTVLLRTPVGESPLPYLAPAVRQLADDVWLVPGGLEPDAPGTVVLSRGLADLVGWLATLDDGAVVDLPGLPKGERFDVAADVASGLCAGLRRFDVRGGATVWAGELDGDAIWCRAKDGGHTVVVDPRSALTRRLRGPSATPEVAPIEPDVPPPDPLLFAATTEILVAIRGASVAQAEVELDAPLAVQLAQRMLGALAHPLPELAPQHRVANAVRLAEITAAWSPRPALPRTPWLVWGGSETLLVADADGGDDPPLLELRRQPPGSTRLPSRYAAYVTDYALRLAFTDGPHFARLELVAPPERAPIPALSPRVTVVAPRMAPAAPRIWALAPGPSASIEARAILGYVSFDEYVAWVVGLDDRRATDLWTPRADRVELGGFDLDAATASGLSIVTLERPFSPLLAAAFGAAYAPTPEPQAVGRMFDAAVWITFEPGRAFVYLDPAARPAWVAAAASAGLAVVEQHSWQSLATLPSGHLSLG